MERDRKRGKTVDTPALEINEASAEDRPLTEFFIFYDDTRINTFSLFLSPHWIGWRSPVGFCRSNAEIQVAVAEEGAGLVRQF